MTNNHRMSNDLSRTNGSDEEENGNEPNSLNAIEIGSANYLPSNYDPRQITYFELLRACERLGIPRQRWPRVARYDPLLLPPKPMYAIVPPFTHPELIFARRRIGPR
jgi:hypothetical protein